MPNDSLTLRITDAGEIVLPGFLAETSLSLAEIGAVVCFAALQSGETALDRPRFSSPEMQDAAKLLRERGILSATLKENKLSIDIDLEKAR